MRTIAFALGFAAAAVLAGAGYWVFLREPVAKTVPSDAPPPNGYWLLKGQPDEAVFLDGQQIVGAGTERTGWIYRVWSTPQAWPGHKPYYVAKMLYRWDCVGRRQRLEGGGAFDKTFASIDEASSKIEEWEAVFPESNHERALTVVCSGGSKSGGAVFTPAKSFRALATSFWSDPKRYSLASAGAL